MPRAGYRNLAVLVVAAVVFADAGFLAGQQNRVIPRPGINGIFIDDDETGQLDERTSRLPNSKESTKALALAKEAIAKADYSTAVELLQQRFLDPHTRPRSNRAVEDSEDYFLDDSMRRSLRTEAEELLGGLPAEGRRAYELQYGVVARQMLDESVKLREPAGIDEVARRFFHTAAGYEATYLLATSNLDHAQPLAAAIAFERLSKVGDDVQTWEPMLSLKTALAWGRAGFTERATKTLRDLKKRYPTGRFTLGGKAVAFFQRDEDALDWLVSVLGGHEPITRGTVDEWHMFRGSPSRNAESLPVAAPLQVAWQFDTTRDLLDGDTNGLEQTRTMLRNVAKSAARQNMPTIPAMQPLVVDDRVIVRSLENASCIDRRTGELRWQTAVNDPMLQQLVATGGIATEETEGSVPTQLDSFLRLRSWIDLTAGTMSTDGRMLYTLEDLQSDDFDEPGANLRQQQFQDFPAPSNKLSAFQISNGRIAWEVGGPIALHSLPEAGSYFLGAPLPLGDELYCLVENGAEVRLVVLDAASGRRKWALSLARAERALAYFPTQKAIGISPAYWDGILICPTTFGSVIAVDPVRRQLLWGHRYTETASFALDNPRIAIQQRILLGRDPGYLLQTYNSSDRWHEHLPVMAEGRVILTPRDVDDLVCLDVLEGKPAWTKPRENGLYVAAVCNSAVIVVARDRVEAWRLADGRPAWKEPLFVPMPAGRGCGSGNLYHLPLSTGEIATIDLQVGRIFARSTLPAGIVPGNLIAAGDSIISQTPDGVVAFRGLQELRKQIDEQLVASPDNAKALALRGELRLHLGDDQRGLADLRRSLEYGANSRTQRLIVNAVMEGLRLDFSRYRQTTTELEELIDDPELMARLFKLEGAGLAKLGEHESAFGAYLKLARLDTKTGGLEQIGEAHSVRRGLWAGSRIAETFQAANADERSRIEPLLREELEQVVDSRHPEKLRWFIQLYGNLPVADAARRALVEWLDPARDALELELQLRRLRTSQDDAFAAEATARLARLLIDRGAPGEATELISELAEQWSDVPCLMDRTGRELADEWSSDPVVSAAMSPAFSWPDRQFHVQRTKEVTPPGPTSTVQIVGPRDPRYAGWTLRLDQRDLKVIARDGTGTERWSMTVSSAARFQGTSYRSHYAFLQGHQLVLVLGDRFVVANMLENSGTPQILWTGSLGFDPQMQDNSAIDLSRRLPLRGGIDQQLEARSRILGAVGPVSENYICYRSGGVLYAADPLTGEILWERRDVSQSSEVFGDRDYLVVAELEEMDAIVLRASDGERVGTCRLPSPDSRILNHGRRILVREFYGVPGKESLNLVDVVTGRTIWKAPITTSSRIQNIEDDEIAVIDPAGHFTVYSLSDGRRSVDSEIEALPVLHTCLVFRGSERYVLFTAIDPSQMTNWSGIKDTRALAVNGPAYGFDRSTGEKLWRSSVEQQFVNIDQPVDVPVMAFATRTMRNLKKDNGAGSLPFALELLDTRNGRHIYRYGTADPPGLFVTSFDPVAKRIDLRFNQFTIELTPGDVPLSTELKTQAE